jgi:peptide deformylase
MIIKNNEDLLRVKCEDVKAEEVGELVATLERELEYSAKLGVPGIGLAAPQIGIAKNIAIVRVNSDISFNLVNCQIAKGYDPAVFRQEGCLSFPGRVEDTIRFQEVHIVNNLVYPHSFVATGLIAVVCQHEIDHLTSKLFIDYLAPKVVVPTKKKVGPNDPCICGSGKKYKKCCNK